MPEDLEKNLTPEAPRMESEPTLEKEPGVAVEAAPVKEAPTEPAPVTSPVTSPAPAAAAEPVDPVVASVEKILSEDLGEFYRELTPAEREKFKAKGEETVGKLRVMLSGATIKVREVLKLIVAWIKMIPGINKFFLEQESKIKTDKIIDLHRRMRGE